MSFMDKLLNAVSINDDYDDDDEFYDDDEFDDSEEEIEEAPKQKSRFSKKMKREDDYEDEFDDLPVKKETTSRSSKKASKSKVTNIDKKSRSARNMNDMEVSVIKPITMENTSEIADNLLVGSPVILNLEGVDVDLAQRIIDFACGTCYAINGNLQRVSGYIFILTPSTVEISGDITDVLNGGIPSMRNDY